MTNNQIAFGYNLKAEHDRVRAGIAAKNHQEQLDELNKKYEQKMAVRLDIAIDKTKSIV